MKSLRPFLILMLMSFISAYGENISHLSTNVLKPGSIYAQNGDSGDELVSDNTNNTTQCAENQTPQNGFCLDSNGACLLPKQGSMQQGFYYEGACSPCGYLNTMGGATNTNCCTAFQDAVQTQDSEHPIVCITRPPDQKCLSAREPSNSGVQSLVTPNSDNSPCGKGWMCKYKQRNGQCQMGECSDCRACKPGQGIISNGNTLVGCRGNDNKCFKPYYTPDGENARQEPYTEGECDPCTKQQKAKSVNGKLFCIDTNAHNACLTTKSTGSQQSFRNENICGCGIDQDGSPVKQYSYPPVGKIGTVCQPCDQTKNQTPASNQNGKFCKQNFMDGEFHCYTQLNRQTAQKIDSNACLPCGKSNCCPENMIKATLPFSSGGDGFTSSNEICLKEEPQLRNGPHGTMYQCKNYSDEGSSNSFAGPCSKCGYVDKTGQFPNCPTCKQWQHERKVEGDRTICVDPITTECWTKVEYPGGPDTMQTRYQPTASGPAWAVKPRCSLCGMYDISKCETTCLQDQKKVQVDGYTFCVDQMTGECHTTLGNGSDEQTKFSEAPCKVCGKWPNEICTDDCPQGQTEQNIGSRSICVVEQSGSGQHPAYQCLTLINTDGKQKPYKPSTGKCAKCGLFKDSYCGGCAPGQQIKQDNKTGKQYCVTREQACLTPRQFDSDVQEPYKEGECYNCGKTACCPTGTPKPSNNPQYCLSGDQCYHLINNRENSDKVPFTDQPCGSCGRFPTTLCHACAEGQTLKHDYAIGVSYCVSNTNGACFSKIDPLTRQQTAYRQSSNPRQPCNLCGKTISACPAQCTAEQTPHYQAGTLTYCTDLKNMCWTPIGNGNSTQSAYTGPECTGCGQYQLTACPNAVCLAGQTQYIANTTPFCVDDTSKQCLNAVGDGITTQSQLIVDDPKHPCAPNSIFCQDTTSVFCQNITQNSMTGSSSTSSVPNSMGNGFSSDINNNSSLIDQAN